MYMQNFKKRIHLVGIGGAGMSALAEVALRMGHVVSGSDLQRTSQTERLESLGIGIQYSHSPEKVKNSDIVIYSSAIKPNNPERVYAQKTGIYSMRRAEMLGDLMRSKFSIGVSGTHGKTTTTAMIGHLFLAAGRDPTVIAGGTLRGHGSNALVGRGAELIAEADEYDRSFLAMYPTFAVINNIEAEHLDCYKNIEDLKRAFVDYANRVPFFGTVFICADDPGAASIIPDVRPAVIKFGTMNDADYCARDISFSEGKARFAILKRNNEMGILTVPVSGIHNVTNALAAVSVASEAGIEFWEIRRAMSKFQGVKRRFELIGSYKGISIIDDYAHHPSEISATLSAARERGFKRLVVAFQPHLYSRTKFFLDKFAESLSISDIIVITGIYKSREESIPGVSSEEIVRLLKISGHRDARYIEDKNDIIDTIMPLLRDGDAVIFMGAGDIGEVGEILLERVKHA